jgi:hypothetical protein
MKQLFEMGPRFSTSVLALALSGFLVPAIVLSQETAGGQDTAAAEAIKTGTFRGVDSFHKGSGQATLLRFPDGSLELRLEDFMVTSGPELHVLLAEHSNPSIRGDLKTQGYVDLGKLRGSRGDQNYEVPGNVNVANEKSVVIYCKPFHVVFSVAPLRDATGQ